MTSGFRQQQLADQVRELGKQDNRCMDAVALRLAGVPAVLVDAATVGTCATPPRGAAASAPGDAIRLGGIMAASELELDQLAGGDDPDEFGYVWQRREGSAHEKRRKREGCR